MSMTIEEAIKRIQSHMRNHHIGEYPHIYIGEALNMAIAALQEKAERENPAPLTIEELRQMDDEPVWVTDPSEPAVSAYCTIDVCTRFKEDRANDKYSEAMVPGGGFSYYQFDKYGKTWIAYRHKPKEDAE